MLRTVAVSAGQQTVASVMPATDRVLQVGNANFASPVPSATKFTQKKISAWAKLSPPPPPADEFATPPEPTRAASAPLDL